MGRPRLLQRPFAHHPPHPDHRRRPRPIDDAFFARRIGRAVELRRDWLGLDAVTDAYRLVHSEGDGLSGLVVDRFGPILVLEFFAAGMYPLPRRHPGGAVEPLSRRPLLLVRRGARPETGIVRLPAAGTAGAGGHHANMASASASLPAASTRPASFSISATTAGRWPPSARASRVLDLCCNTGGFAVYAKALGGAEEVVGVDLDEQALALARQNAGLNQVRIRFVQADLFPWLRDIVGRAASASTWWCSTRPSRRATARRSTSP